MVDLLEHEPGYRANVFVHADAPQYQAMLAWSKKADKYDWCLDPMGRKGIWVSLSEFNRVNSAGWRAPSYAEQVQQLSQEVK